MKVVSTRNVHQALPKAVLMLQTHGIERQSRNGPVLVAPWPVTTVYANPMERVIFWRERDANPAFHLYESLWMLAGRHDVEPLLRYVKDFGQFSDDHVTLHGAYGYRWRHSLGEDQLALIAKRLRTDPDDRRCVLQMWQGEYDLDRVGKDVPCNTIATFQRDADGRLDLTVFCRSNDIVWGAYGANAVHFGYLLEYMAAWIGCPVGVYRQVSVNWHAYLKTFAAVSDLPKRAMTAPYATANAVPCPYSSGEVYAQPLVSGTIEEFDRRSKELLFIADHDFAFPIQNPSNDDHPFFETAFAVLRAHHLWRTLSAPERFEQSMRALGRADQRADWVVAMRDWINRRFAVWQGRQLAPEVTHG